MTTRGRSPSLILLGVIKSRLLSRHWVANWLFPECGKPIKNANFPFGFSEHIAIPKFWVRLRGKEQQTNSESSPKEPLNNCYNTADYI
jgi:hypothetical protein